MKYSQVDWSKWDDRPEEGDYNDWLDIRKDRKHTTSQRAMNLAAKWANKLYQKGYSSSLIFDRACENSLANLEWVYVREAKMSFSNADMRQVVIAEPNVVNIDRSTRDITLEEELTDRTWAL